MNKTDLKKCRNYDGWTLNNGVPAKVKTVDPVKAERHRQLEEAKNRMTYGDDEFKEVWE